ncbi:MAG: uroporphyrinogen-III C-methyltransferase [Betaproteobacteria bacterium]
MQSTLNPLAGGVGQRPVHPVLLVGAGPGDPELLTVKAVKALQQASVILVDDLVGQQVVDAYANPQARIVRVGKRGGCRSTPQAFIERLMIRCALRGERVLRLKGGDPFIFGRGGEEVEHLQRAGLRVEVINGITAGLAAVSSLNTPLTHRDHAQGVVLITGHAREQGQPLDWAQLGRSAHALRLTLVIYMGMAGLSDIATALQQGLPPSTPALVVQGAATPEQRQLSAPLSQIAPLARQAGLGSPAVVVIGDVLAGLQAALAQASQADTASPQARAA